MWLSFDNTSNKIDKKMLIPWKNITRFSSKFCKQPDYALRVAFKRAQAYTAYYAGGGKSSFPESITFFLTHRCNLRCKMCGQWGESGVTKKKPGDSVREELALSELKKVIDQVSSFKPNITLFGGEPLLYGDCVELIRCIKKKGMHCLMISNGTLLQNHALALVDAGLDELNISLDGDRELHNQIRGLPQVFEKIISGLELINKYKKEKKLKKPLINLQCTITKYNYEHLEQLTLVAQKVNADSLTYHNLIFLGSELIEKQRLFDEQLNCSSKDWEGFVFNPEINPESLYAKMKEIKDKHYPFAVDFYPNLTFKGLKEYYNNPTYLPSEYPPRCLSPWIVVYVFSDGSVKPCLNSSYSFGNVKETDFTGIWNSTQAVKFRQLLKKNNLFAACVRCTELYRY